MPSIMFGSFGTGRKSVMNNAASHALYSSGTDSELIATETSDEFRSSKYGLVIGKNLRIGW